MIPYLVLLFGTMAVAYVGRRFGGQGVRRLSAFLIVVTLVLFAGLRDRTIGLDTGNYVSWLSRVNSLEELLAFHIEIGFGLLVLVGSWLSDGYAALLLLIAIMAVSFYLIPILKLVPRYEVAIFVFISLGFYTFFFNGARQGVAAAICFFAMPWLLERKAIPYFLTIAFAALFHKTALVALPLYFIATSRVGWRELLLIVAGAVFLSVTISSFAQLAAILIDEKYATYGQSGKGGGEVKVAFLLGQALLLFYFKKQVGHNNIFYGRLLNIYLIGLVPALASVIGSVNPSGVLRLSIYFSHTSILLWPMVFMSFRRLENRVIVTGSFFIIAVVYFILTTSTFSSLTPYQLNSEIFW